MQCLLYYLYLVFRLSRKLSWLITTRLCSTGRKRGSNMTLLSGTHSLKPFALSNLSPANIGARLTMIGSSLQLGLTWLKFCPICFHLTNDSKSLFFFFFFFDTQCYCEPKISNAADSLSNIKQNKDNMSGETKRLHFSCLLMVHQNSGEPFLTID